jgi:ABC-type multidrug transport system ATPase subunit
MIDIKNLSVNLKTIEISFDNFTFEKSKITIVSGKNGSGKTTLLKAIAGLLEYKGDLQVNGEVTYNSQEPVIFNRTVYENIAYPLKIRKLDLLEYDEKIWEYCKILEMGHLINNNALKLSSGEKMKVSIIRSIIFDPDIVLLDEPTTHLDLDSINELSTLIRRLKKDMTFIIVSHNKTFIDTLMDVEYKIGGNHVLS